MTESILRKLCDTNAVAICAPIKCMHETQNVKREWRITFHVPRVLCVVFCVN
jgi:hypothetical protein